MRDPDTPREARNPRASCPNGLSPVSIETSACTRNLAGSISRMGGAENAKDFFALKHFATFVPRRGIGSAALDDRSARSAESGTRDSELILIEGRRQAVTMGDPYPTRNREPGTRNSLRCRRVLAVWAAIWIALSALVLAGEEMDVRTYASDGTREETGRIYIEDANFFRFDPDVDAQGTPQDNSIIFRADTGRFIVLDPDEKDYLILDEQRVQQFSSQLKKQLQEMRKRLDEAPPDQRDAIEQMMKAQPPSSALRFSLGIRKVGPDEGATKYEVLVNGKKTSEVWAKPLEAVGLQPGALELIQKMSSFYDSVMKSLSSDLPQITFGDNPFAGIAQMNGFPVKIKDVETGRVTEIGNAKTVDLDMALFAPPPDYTERRISFK